MRVGVAGRSRGRDDVSRPSMWCGRFQPTFVVAEREQILSHSKPTKLKPLTGPCIRWVAVILTQTGADSGVPLEYSLRVAHPFPLLGS